MRADEDPSLRARIVRRVALMYAGGADAALDRPAHVRAASGLCWWRGRLAVVSDDASFLGVIDPETGLTTPITLPHAPGGVRQFDKGRGNKPDKLDLECVTAVGERLYAFGSDSGLAVRRQIAVIDGVDGAPRIVAVPRLYEAMRSPVLGRGCVNLEGAAADGDRLVLGNRGGDVGEDGVATRDAIAALELAAFTALVDDPAHAPVPTITWHPLDLGDLDGAPLHLTELHSVNGGLRFAATAEATTTAYDDGRVTGSVVGFIAGPLDNPGIRWSRAVDETGAPLVAKIEGIVAGLAPDRFLVAIDADDPARPSELLEISLSGPEA
ncbi:MAG TPA: hypothetical protein VM261_20685 [Kofleriaceae bacterium]|nr:hypothetical protein [Kofleriaceae bacterium]